MNIILWLFSTDLLNLKRFIWELANIYVIKFLLFASGVLYLLIFHKFASSIPWCTSFKTRVLRHVRQELFSGRNTRMNGRRDEQNPWKKNPVWTLQNIDSRRNKASHAAWKESPQAVRSVLSHLLISQYISLFLALPCLAWVSCFSTWEVCWRLVCTIMWVR